MLTHSFARFGIPEDINHSPCLYQGYSNANVIAKTGEDSVNLKKIIFKYSLRWHPIYDCCYNIKCFMMISAQHHSHIAIPT